MVHSCFYFFMHVMNFKKTGISSPKKPSFSGYEHGYMMQQPKKSVSLLTLFIVVVCTFLVMFALFKNFDRISNRLSSVESSTWFEIGQTVSLSGLLQANGDIVTYTHTLTLADTTVLGLKSRTLDMSVYTGFVDVQWTIEKQFNNVFIVEVNFVSGALASMEVTGALLWSWSGIYISQAGIYLPAEFGTKYTILDQTNGIFKVQNISTNQTISVSYFVCKISDPNKNCAQLQKNISTTAEKTNATSYGVSLYKLEWVTSWFFTNNNLYGYFINDVSEQEAMDVANAFILPSPYYIQHTLLSKLQTLCTDWSTSLIQVTTHALGVDTNWLIVNIQWPTADGSAICKVAIDPSQAAGGSKISYISNTSTTATDTSTTTKKPTITIDTSVKQFPINLEKTMTFTSSKRWYSIVFPSSNIAYEALNVDEGLDLPGVRCSSQMNVTKFADKATMTTDPKVKIFSCSIKGTLNNIGNSIIQKTSANGIQFLIQIMDPAWAEFATNIQIN